MALKVASREAMTRLIEWSRDKVPPPQKLVEHRERIEAWTQALEAKWKNQGGIYEHEMEFVTQMRMRLDGMYVEWAEGVERVRWVDLPAKSDLSPDDIVRETCYDTEAVYGATGVEALARYLELFGYEGIFKKLAERFLLDARALIEEAMPFDRVAGVLNDPKGFFGVTDDQEARDLTVEHFLLHVDGGSPKHVQRAMVAHIEFGLGNYVEAINHTGFALNEKEIHNFEDELYRKGSKIAEAVLLAAERRKAEILIELLGK